MDIDRKVKALVEDEDFLSLFNGKFEVSGTGKGWEDALAWLGKDGNTLRKAMSCIMLFVHPLRYVEAGMIKTATGEIKRADETFQGYDKSLLSFLPKLENLDSIKNSERREAAFGKVNFSMVKRVALMTLEVLPNISVVHQWTKKHKGRPSTCPLPTEGSESARITREVLLTFRAEYKEHVADFTQVLRN